MLNDLKNKQITLRKEVTYEMAQPRNTQKKALDSVRKRFTKSLDQVQSLIDDMSVSLYGTTTKDESDTLNDRFNDIMDNEINDITGNGVNDYSTFIGKLYDADTGNSRILNEINDKLDLDVRGNGLNPMQYINEQYKNRMIQLADADQISNQLIELKEAKSVMRDAIISTDLNSGRINRLISFEKSTVNDAGDEVKPIIEQMEKKFNLQAKIKNITDKVLGYGEYYVYTIPYHEMFANFARRYKTDSKQGRNFFEWVDEETHDSIKIQYIGDPLSESNDKEFFESAGSYISDAMGYNSNVEKKEHESMIHDDLSKLINDRITVSTDYIPLAFLEEGFDSLQNFADSYITESGDFFTEAGIDKSRIQRKRGTKDGVALDGDESFLRKYGGGEDGVYNDGSIKSEKDDTKFEDLKDCYIKEVSPLQMIPVQIMGHTIFYIYVQTESATPLDTILNYQSQFRAKDPSNRVDNLVDDIATKVVSKFNQKFISENKEFKEIIAGCLQYYELGNTRIHFQVVPKEYVTEFKINKDENGNGHSMLENSLFYAKLYLMLLMFKIVTIVTKSNDQEINYIRTSGIDKNVYNKAQRIARQKQARRITVNDMFSYTGVINKVGSGNAIYMPVGRNNERPIETEILQGQNVEMNNDLMEMLRTNYILGTGVPSAIMNYLNEADFAKSIETANTKMNGRVVNYQIDLNDSVTELYQKILRYTSNVEEENITSLRIKFAEPKGASNVTTRDLIDNYSSLQDFLTKVYFGDSPIDDNHVRLFQASLAKLHLPMINFEKIDDIYKATKLKASGKSLKSDADEIDDALEFGDSMGQQ